MREFLADPAVLQYAVEPRITAVEVVMIYEKGSLRSASSQTGPVTTSVKTILTVPLTFVPLRKERTVPDYLEIMADVYMETEPFARLNQDRSREDLCRAFRIRRLRWKILCYRQTPGYRRKDR